jgi:hypothetical protein
MKTTFKYPVIVIVASLLILASCKKEEPIIENEKATSENQTTLKSANSSLLKSASTVQVVSDNNDATFTLFAGQSINAGTVKVKKDNENITITYETTNEWTLSEVHAWIGDDLINLPTNKGGNPTIGLFPYKQTNLGGVTQTSITIPISVALGVEPVICDKSFYLVAHAVVVKTKADGSVQKETGWSEGNRITNKGSWATISSFVFKCNDEGEPKSGGCETAYGVGATTFIDANLTNSRWGWIITVNQIGSFSTPIYAGAAQNDLNKGTLVGHLFYTFNGNSLNVTYVLLNGYKLYETHVYAGNSLPTTIAPGQYGHIHELNGASEDVFSININGAPIYLVAHAVVCEDN